jgi:hypothetical protein
MGCAAGEMRERFQDEDSFQATVKQAEEAAESGNRPIQYPVSNQWIKKNAARFLSSKLRDDKHNGDKTKFFNHLDADSDKEITLAEMELVQAHAAEMAAEDGEGGHFYRSIYRTVHEFSQLYKRCPWRAVCASRLGR